MISERAAKIMLKATSENREHSPEGIREYKECCEHFARWLATELENNMKTIDEYNDKGKKGETPPSNTRVQPLHVEAAFTRILKWRGE